MKKIFIFKSRVYSCINRSFLFLLIAICSSVTSLSTGATLINFDDTDSNIIVPQPTNSSFELWQIKSTSGQPSMGYVIRTIPSQNIIVIDGGFPSDVNMLRNFISSLTPSDTTNPKHNRVDHWFISHPHPDHMGALYELLVNPTGNPSGTQLALSITNIYGSFLAPSDTENILSEGTRSGAYDLEQQWPERFFNAMSCGHETCTACGIAIPNKNSGIRYCEISDFRSGPNYPTYTDFPTNNVEVNLGDGVKMKILSVKENPVSTKSIEDGVIVNNSSIIMKLYDNVRSVLFTGDIAERASDLLTSNNPLLNDFKADYVQMTHHGSYGALEDFYRHVGAVNCLWPITQESYESHLDPYPNNSAHPTYTTEQVRTWMRNICAKNYLAFRTSTDAEPDYLNYVQKID